MKELNYGVSIMIQRKKVDELKPGMIVAKDVYTNTSGLVVTENSVLTERGIARLIACSVKCIAVKDTMEEKAEQEILGSKDILPHKTALERIKESDNFKSFYEDFQVSLKETEQVLNDMVLQEDRMDQGQILTLVDRVLNNRSNGIEIFDMLHCMREEEDLIYTHSMNVAVICKVFGEWLKLPKEDIKVLEVAGLLHDVGKLFIPPEILNKKDSLSPSEYSIIKKHSESGYDLMKNKEMDERIKEVILCHHEKCDGSGYPRGLHGDEIDDFSKIVAIADSYDAMTSKRVYRSSICPFTVIADFEENGLQKYDPKFLLPLLKIIVQSYIGSNVLLSSGKIGEVIMLHPFSLSKPVVRVEEEYIDLSKESSLTIQSIL